MGKQMEHGVKQEKEKKNRRTRKAKGADGKQERQGTLLEKGREWETEELEKPAKREARRKMLLALMQDPSYRPMKRKELAVLLGVSREQREELYLLLEELEKEGKLSVSSHGKYGKPGAFSAAGLFTANARGFGFVHVEGREKDVFIPPDQMKDALNGDEVLIEIVKSRSDQMEGRVCRVLTRGQSEVVGTYQKSTRFGFVVPDNRRILRDFFVRPENSMGALQGQKVVAKILDYGTEHQNPEGMITEILGNLSDPGTDILSIARAAGLPMEFPEEALKEAHAVEQQVRAEELAGRLDLRKAYTITIDGEDAKDLDDAISLHQKDGHYYLGVHIADVSHYVKEISALDREAFDRGTSIYLVDRVLPMLPPELSNGICSLNAGKDRLTLSCLFELNEVGEVCSHQLAETVICVNQRMSYSGVQRLLDAQETLNGGNFSLETEKTEQADSQLLEMLTSMRTLSGLLRSRRSSRGAIDFDFPEAKIILNERGKAVAIHPYERNDATRMIEDFMLLTNETIAEEFFWLELPFLYRIHEQPDEEKMRAFSTFLNHFGFSLHFSNGELHPKELQKLMTRLEGSSAEGFIGRVLLRSMKKARYSPNNEGHFGLSAKYYCHFTSPIRRYPDLQIHRIIKDYLHGELVEERIAHYEQLLPEAADWSSQMERRAEEAEREVERMKKAEYMRKHIGERYSGVICGVTAHGLYVELENTVEGMVSLSSLYDDYYLFQEQNYQLVGEMTGKSYSLGQRVEVFVEQADPITKMIDFQLVME